MARLALVAILAFELGCGAARAATGPEAPRLKAPDTSGILTVKGRFTLAKACPVSPNWAITAAHVMEPFPHLVPPQAYPVRWSSGGSEGLVDRAEVWQSADLALIHSATPFPSWYEVDKDPPTEGTVLWYVGFDMSSKRKAFKDKHFIAKVLGTHAGHVSYDPAGEPGTSGSCLLDESGRVRGINIQGWAVGYKDEVGVGVGTWAPWFDPILLNSLDGSN